MAVGSTEIDLGARAVDFRLPATAGRDYALHDVAGENGAVIVFICNHCPYVKAVIGRLTADARLLIGEGVGFAAICSNDAASYPEDSFANMREFARRHDFPFPYLHDETQDVARAYGAVCTPDFFGFGRDLKLKYRGRLDAGRTTPPPPGARRELLEAMRAIATTGLAGGPSPVDRLLDQVEGRPRLKAPRLFYEAMRGKERPQLMRGPRISLSADLTCRQVSAPSLSSCRSQATPVRNPSAAISESVLAIPRASGAIS